MVGWGLDLLSNIIANVVFWLALGLIVRYTIVSKTRAEFLRFFHLEKNKKLVVYLSNLWLSSLSQKPWGCILSGYEFRVTKTINSLFGSAPFNFPELVKGLVDSFWIGRSLDVSVEISPTNESFDHSNNMILVGASTKNRIRRYYVRKNMVYITIAGEPVDQPDDKDVLQSPLRACFVIHKGSEAGETWQYDGEHNLAVIERICDEKKHTAVIMCTGLKGDSSWAATEYLARHWRELFREYGDQPFARCLWFPENEEPMEAYQEPVKVKDVPMSA